MPFISVIVPTHNPNRGRLACTLAGLAAQTLPPGEWETILVDNTSVPGIAPAELGAAAPSNLHVVVEPQLGLSHARRRGLLAARGDIVILVDDDNVLDAAYLARTREIFARHPRLGAIGGPSRPEFERAPASWMQEFYSLLALRDLGPQAMTAGLRSGGEDRDRYPACAPIGAGMALRRAAAQPWLDGADPAGVTDRRGSDLSSSGDNEIVVLALRAGWLVGYFPDLALRHLIPAARLEPAYLARLNRGIQRSWLQLLLRHNLSPWPAIPRWSVRPRQWRAWYALRAWSGDAARIRWQGVCGHFEGRVQ